MKQKNYCAKQKHHGNETPHFLSLSLPSGTNHIIYYHLHVFVCLSIFNRTTIEQYDKDNFPPPEKIPAISLLLQDRKLFQIFLSMLRSKGTKNETTPSPSIKRNGAGNAFGLKKNMIQPMRQLNKHPKSQKNLNGVESRKRSLSGSAVNDFDIPNSKKAKLMRSPIVDRKEYSMGKNLGSVMPIPLMNSNTASSSSLTANFAVLAVITFYSAFQYLDQWPAILVKV